MLYVLHYIRFINHDWDGPEVIYTGFNDNDLVCSSEELHTLLVHHSMILHYIRLLPMIGPGRYGPEVAKNCQLVHESNVIATPFASLDALGSRDTAVITAATATICIFNKKSKLP